MSSSSSSSSSSSELPYFCPRCGHGVRFSSVPELRAHLVSRHTYETLLVLSQARARSSRPGALLPLPSPAVSQGQSSSLGMEAHGVPLPLACLDLASSSASIRLLRNAFGPPGDPCTTVALPGAGLQLGVELGLAVGIGLEERLGLGLDHRIARTFAEVEDQVNRRMGRMRAELQRREAELERERQSWERLRSEKQEVEERAAYLSRQVSAAAEMMKQLKKDLEGKEEELRERQQEMEDIELFLRQTAEKEAEAKSRLQAFIEALLDRADRAERQLLLLGSHTHHTLCTHSRYTPAPGRGGRSLDGSIDDIIAYKVQEGSISSQRSYSVSDSYSLHHCRVEEGGYWRMRDRRNLRHCSTEDDEDEDDEEEEEEELWSSTEMKSLLLTRTFSPASEGPSSLRSTPSRRHGDSRLGADTLRLRAGLFCVFPYLDVSSLLRAAEVCSDWRFVARHPAVWTRLHLEDARVSVEFLSTLARWCTQTQTMVLNNLKPRSRRAEEPREDYLKSTRGSLEEGVEALLRSAGGSLLHLSVSRCPHVLTDRTLWLVSCYSRNLLTLSYRSSSDPVGQEVLWALGSGCRSISSLQVAPLHPCQQPTRFGDRCLQTIGRCWPRLRSLSVGGAGCGPQGLADLVRTCAHLQVLELERLTDLGLQAATELSGAGLKSLETLILNHTPVSGQAILHLHGACPNIRCIRVQVSSSDYFEDPDSQEAQHLFGEILNTLKVLQERPGLCDVLQVEAEGKNIP